MAALVPALAAGGTAFAAGSQGRSGSQATSHVPPGVTPGGGNGHAGGNSHGQSNDPGADHNSAGSSGGGNQGKGPDSLPPQAQPVAGKSVDAGTARGSVTVVLPGSSQAIPLSDASSLPVGTVIDATHGAVTLTSVKSSTGTTQTGEFWGAAFRIGQTRGARPVTELTLVDPPLGACSAPSQAQRLAIHAASSRRRVTLWGHDHHGSFRTRGRGAVASVRGTEWMTQDSCAGTLVQVRQGAVSVRDLQRHRTVVVRAGHSYLART